MKTSNIFNTLMAYLDLFLCSKDEAKSAYVTSLHTHLMFGFLEPGQSSPIENSIFYSPMTFRFFRRLPQLHFDSLPSGTSLQNNTQVVLKYLDEVMGEIITATPARAINKINFINTSSGDQSGQFIYNVADPKHITIPSTSIVSILPYHLQDVNSTTLYLMGHIKSYNGVLRHEVLLADHHGNLVNTSGPSDEVMGLMSAITWDNDVHIYSILAIPISGYMDGEVVKTNMVLENISKSIDGIYRKSNKIVADVDLKSAVDGYDNLFVPLGSFILQIEGQITGEITPEVPATQDIIDVTVQRKFYPDSVQITVRSLDFSATGLAFTRAGSISIDKTGDNWFAELAIDQVATTNAIITGICPM